MKTNATVKCGLALAWIGVGAAYYWKVEGFRAAVDAWLPWRPPAVAATAPPPAARIVAKPAAPAAPAPIAESAPIAAPAIAREPPAPEPPAPSVAEPPPSVSEFQRLAQDRALWPRTVQLREPVSFPAVKDGKVVGRIHLPARSVVNLVKMSGEKIGLEYRGGGAWVRPEQTDLLEQVRLTRQLRAGAPSAAR